MSSGHLGTLCAAALALGAAGTVCADGASGALPNAVAGEAATAPGASVADGTPEQVASLIRSMTRALRTLDYEGTFVHLVGDNLTSLRIVHSNEGAGERERLSSLDGEAREVFRDRSLVTCVWPGSRSVVVSSSKPRSPLPAIDASLGDSRLYRLSSLADDRVAGRATQVIEVVPHDALRYGYRFWLDSDNAMLLRSMLLDERGRPLEQMMFTHIEYPERIDPARFEIAGEGARASWIDGKLAQARSEARVAPSWSPADASAASGMQVGEVRIGFERLPEGYEPLGEQQRSASSAGAPVSHLMLGDGMASVSVYVEHLSEEDHGENVPGAARMGAVNVFGLSLPDAFVTALGEVPAETVRRIAQSVRVSR